MNSIVCYDYLGIPLKNLYQWDSNQRILISGIDIVSSIEVHFCHPDSSEALVLTPNIDGVNIVSTIPNILLQQAKPLIVYVFQDSEESGARTINTLRIPVYPRPKPADYIYTETEVLCYRKIDERLRALEAGGVTGGYYTPELTQTDENTLQFSFTASNQNMPVVNPVNVTLPGNSSNDSAQNGNQTSSGWSTEEILILETILKNCVTQSDQTNNINSLITLLKSNSSGSEGSGGSSGGSGDSGNETYSVVLNLTGVTASNVATSVKSGSVYINQLSVGEGYELGTPVISMGGNDVTGQYYSGDGVISIPSVQGDIVITCKALAVTPLTFVGVKGLPDSTFAYTTSAGLGQYNMIEDCGIVGGTLRLSWDTERITGGPGFHVYLFKDGAPYKIGGVNGANTTEDVIEGENIGTAYWYDPSACASGASRMIIPTAPCSVKIPAGCTAAVCLNKGSLALDGTNVANSTFGAFIREGNLTATMTEGG